VGVSQHDLLGCKMSQPSLTSEDIQRFRRQRSLWEAIHSKNLVLVDDWGNSLSDYFQVKEDPVEPTW